MGAQEATAHPSDLSSNPGSHCGSGSSDVVPWGKPARFGLLGPGTDLEL